jgi:2-polyprenyl-3-methyl-5-hydroxy-6-metoxy-1,4-benzoquinol methylase
MRNQFTSHGYHYRITTLGVIEQIDPEPYTYDEAYSAIYDTEAYSRQSDLLQALRLGFAVAALGRPPRMLLDVGYGNGAFMRMARQYVPVVNGMDITGVQVPEGCSRVTDYYYHDVVTFHDCLEHIHNLSFLGTLPAGVVVISLPYCHVDTQGVEWFSNGYKHRKPNEHVRHFNDKSLEALMAHYDWRMVAKGHHEDIVRKSTHGLPNILTMAFKKF